MEPGQRPSVPCQCCSSGLFLRAKHLLSFGILSYRLAQKLVKHPLANHTEKHLSMQVGHVGVQHAIWENQFSTTTTTTTDPTICSASHDSYSYTISSGIDSVLFLLNRLNTGNMLTFYSFFKKNNKTLNCFL